MAELRSILFLRSEQIFTDLGWRVPRIDVREEPNAYSIAMEVPGIPKEQIEILTTEDRLEVRGEAKGEREEEKKGYRYREIGRCAFRCVVPLPEDADREKVDAKLENGVLTLTVPKLPGKITTRKVTVK